MKDRQQAAFDRAVRSLIDRFDADDLCRLISSGDARASDLDRLPQTLLRSNIIFTTPDAEQQKRRDASLLAAQRAIGQAAGPKAEARFSDALSTIKTLESGYAVLVKLLDERVAGADPAAALWGSLSLAADQVGWALTEIDAQLGKSDAVDGTSYTIPDGEGGRYRADELIAMIDATTSTILRMYAARWGWGSRDGELKFPTSVPVSEVDAALALDVQTLAQAWDAWRRIDDNVRFLGGKVEQLFDRDTGERVWRHVPDPDGVRWQRLNLAAHEQLSAEIASVFHKLAFRDDAGDDAAGINTNSPLFPGAFISVSELQAAHTLNIVLSNSVASDTSLYGGLRLIEWIRGYATLAEVADQCARGAGGAGRLLMIKTEGELLQQLSRLGLRNHRAKTFLEKVTFSKRSRDLVDEPLIKLNDGRYLLFGPSLANAEVTRILLSKLARDGVSFERRGKRFEADMFRRFEEWGLSPAKFIARRGCEQFDYDLVVPWDGYIFMFECKSRGGSGTDPARAWQGQQAWRASLAQTQRLAQGLRQYPDILDEHLGTEFRHLKVVPCVLSALPFQIPGRVDGVYFTDFPALATFFEIGEVGVYATHRLPGLPPVRQRLFGQSLWTGPAPAAADLLRYLDEAPTLKVIMGHLQEQACAISIGDFQLESTEIFRLPDSVERAIETLGGDGAGVLEDTARLSAALKRLAEMNTPT